MPQFIFLLFARKDRSRVICRHFLVRYTNVLLRFVRPDQSETFRAVGGGLFFFGLGAFDLPFARQEKGPFFCAFHNVVELLAEFAANVYIAVFRAVDNKIEMTGVARLVRLHADEFNIVALIGAKRGQHNEQCDGKRTDQEGSHIGVGWAFNFCKGKDNRHVTKQKNLGLPGFFVCIAIVSDQYL
jgi:hypothetical protein